MVPALPIPSPFLPSPKRSPPPFQNVPTITQPSGTGAASLQVATNLLLGMFSTLGQCETAAPAQGPVRTMPLMSNCENHSYLLAYVMPMSFCIFYLFCGS